MSRRPAPSDPVEHLRQLWYQGVGIGPAIRHVWRATGTRLTFDQAQHHFARWADEFLGRAA